MKRKSISDRQSVKTFQSQTKFWEVRFTLQTNLSAVHNNNDIGWYPYSAKAAKVWQKVVYNLFANSNTTPPEYDFKQCEWSTWFHGEFSLRCSRPVTSLGHLGAKSFLSGAQILKTMFNIFPDGEEKFCKGSLPALLPLVTDLRCRKGKPFCEGPFALHHSQFEKDKRNFDVAPFCGRPWQQVTIFPPQKVSATVVAQMMILYPVCGLTNGSHWH